MAEGLKLSHKRSLEERRVRVLQEPNSGLRNLEDMQHRLDNGVSMLRILSRTGLGMRIFSTRRRAPNDMKVICRIMFKIIPSQDIIHMRRSKFLINIKGNNLRRREHAGSKVRKRGTARTQFKNA